MRPQVVVRVDDPLVGIDNFLVDLVVPPGRQRLGHSSPLKAGTAARFVVAAVANSNDRMDSVTPASLP
jgi:hypothetical protein